MQRKNTNAQSLTSKVALLANYDEAAMGPAVHVESVFWVGITTITRELSSPAQVQRQA